MSHSTGLVCLNSQLQRCSRNVLNLTHEPIDTTGPPKWPFQQIVMDLFYVESFSYLACAEKLTGWFILYHIKSGKAVDSRLISICRDIFQAYGTPEELSTDGGPPCSAYSFQQFLKNWAVKQRISSVAYPQSYERAELAVKTAKRLIKDCTGHQGSLENDVAAQSILQYRNSPIQGIGSSPAQHLLHRRLRDFIPSQPYLYKPHPEWIATAPKSEKTLSKRNADLIKRYNRTAHALSLLCKGDIVSIKNPNSHRWDIYGRIVETLPKSQYRFRIAGSDRITLRNHRFLRKLKAPVTENPIQSALPVSPEQTITDMGRQHQSAKELRNGGITLRRAQLNHRHQEPGFPGRYLDCFRTIGRAIRNSILLQRLLFFRNEESREM